MLILPPPGTPGSLSANKDLVIGNDTVAPSNVTISINNGDASTDSRRVKLKLTAADNSGVTGYYLSEDQTTPSASAEGWFTLKPIAQFYGIEFTNLSSETLTGTYTKTIYVWFKDAKGNVSNRTSDSIQFIKESSINTDQDMTPPKILLVTSTNPDGKYKLGDNLSITVNFDERVIIKDNESEKLWSNLLGTISHESGHKIEADNLDNIYIFGRNITDINTGKSDLFLNKYDKNEIIYGIKK